MKPSGAITLAIALISVVLSAGSIDTRTASSAVYAQYIIVGFKPDLGLIVDGGMLMAREDADDPLLSDLAQIQQIARTVQPVFSRLPGEIISERATVSTVAKTEFPDLTRWIMIRPSTELPVNDALEMIIDLPSVETAYIKPTAYPASVGAVATTSTPHFSDLQGYLRSAPEGNGAYYAWSIEGGSGKGITIADLEGDWQNRHKDLHLTKKKVNGVRAGKTTYWYHHGTAVMGIIGGRKNGFGVTGIAFKSRQLMYSIFRRNEDGEMYNNVADSIDRAAARLSKGDIILIEVQYSGLKSDSAFIPVEYYQDVFEAIKAATAKGIVVVEAAANGSQDLDGELYEERFDISVRGDSGAIMVGAGGVPEILPSGVILSGRDRKKLWFSNYGKRIDVQNWGERVVATGYGDLYSAGGRNTYTSSFNGTSSAAAITAGVCASLQGIAKSEINRYLTPEELRTILRSTGSPQLGDDSSGYIGPRPNLKKAVRAVKKLDK